MRIYSILIKDDKLVEYNIEEESIENEWVFLVDCENKTVKISHVPENLNVDNLYLTTEAKNIVRTVIKNELRKEKINKLLNVF